MFVLYAKKNQLTVRQKEPVTNGSVKVYEVQFEFSDDWAGMDRTAVFRAGKESVSVLLDESNVCTIPWEALEHPEVKLFCGVCGTTGAETVLPTVWADLGWIATGARPGQPGRPPTPELWEQQLARKGDRLGYTGEGELGLYAGDRLLSSVPIEGGGGTAYPLGHGLKLDNGKMVVDTVSDFSGDNTLPMTAAGVQTTIGNIEALLGTI